MKQNDLCKSCRSGKLLKQEVVQTFERQGLEVKMEGIPAIVCEKCGQIYFPPGIGDKISEVAKQSFAISEIKYAGECEVYV